MYKMDFSVLGHYDSTIEPGNTGENLLCKYFLALQRHCYFRSLSASHFWWFFIFLLFARSLFTRLEKIRAQQRHHSRSFLTPSVNEFFSSFHSICSSLHILIFTLSDVFSQQSIGRDAASHISRFLLFRGICIININISISVIHILSSSFVTPADSQLYLDMHSCTGTFSTARQHIDNGLFFHNTLNNRVCFNFINKRLSIPHEKYLQTFIFNSRDFLYVPLCNNLQLCNYESSIINSSASLRQSRISHALCSINYFTSNITHSRGQHGLQFICRRICPRQWIFRRTVRRCRVPWNSHSFRGRRTPVRSFYRHFRHRGRTHVDGQSGRKFFFAFFQPKKWLSLRDNWIAILFTCFFCRAMWRLITDLDCKNILLSKSMHRRKFATSILWTKGYWCSLRAVLGASWEEEFHFSRTRKKNTN